MAFSGSIGSVRMRRGLMHGVMAFASAAVAYRLNDHGTRIMLILAFALSIVYLQSKDDARISNQKGLEDLWLVLAGFCNYVAFYAAVLAMIRVRYL